MCHVLKVFIVVVVIGVSLAKVAPDYIEICPGLKSDCLKNTIQKTIPLFSKGIPSLGVISLDPYKDDNVKLELPGGFQVHLNNGVMTGLRKCVVDDVKYENHFADLTLRCNCTIKGQYKAKGQILIVSINGEGDAKIKTTDIIISAKIRFEDTVRDGKVYYEIKDSKISHKYGGKVQFSLTNLFRGNPELSEAVLLFLNQNWKQVSEEFGKPVFDRIVTMVFATIKGFFERVPKEELFA